MRRFAKSERWILTFLVTVVICIIATIYWKGNQQKHSSITTLHHTEIDELQAFEEAIGKDSLAWEENRKRNRSGQSDATQAETFPFDPNTADSTTFLRLGLRSWQVRNALQYRRKGGRWRTAEDFRRLYGLSDVDYQRLHPYIRIVPTPAEVERTARQSHYDSIRATRLEKYAEGTILDLNEADTTQLKGIPGIGSWRAQAIVRYRERLGGFISVRQLREIEDLPEGIERWFNISPNTSTRKIALNEATFKQLVRHPYLSYEQVRDIVTHIRLHGSLRSWSDLNLSPHFTQKDFERLQPYFSF